MDVQIKVKKREGTRRLSSKADAHASEEGEN
jgi:hypothetical protein